MAEWSVKPQWKKSIIERSYYHKDGATIVAETGWRGGEFTVYTDDDNPPEIEAGVDIYDCDYETELVETFDGCWEEVTIDDEDQEEWLEEFLEENSWLDLEEHGWHQGDTEMIIDCDLIIERVDGETEQIIHTGQTEEEIINQLEVMTTEAEARAMLEKPTQWPWGPEQASTVETVKWPFERPHEGPKEVVEEEPEVTDWFPVSINPVREGVYEILTKESINWPYPNKGLWDGKKWNFLDHTVTEWRGLAKDPGVKNGS